MHQGDVCDKWRSWKSDVKTICINFGPIRIWSNFETFLLLRGLRKMPFSIHLLLREEPLKDIACSNKNFTAREGWNTMPNECDSYSVGFSGSQHWQPSQKSLSDICPKKSAQASRGAERRCGRPSSCQQGSVPPNPPQILSGSWNIKVCQMRCVAR